MDADIQGIIFYGFKLPRLVVDACDLNDKWAKEHCPPRPEDRSDYKSPEWEEWRQKLREYEATPCHVEIAWSGVEEEPQYYVHCPCCCKKVYWGEMLKLEPAQFFTEMDGAKQWLYAFCDRFNLPKSEPSWYLASRYF